MVVLSYMFKYLWSGSVAVAEVFVEGQFVGANEEGFRTGF